MDLWEQQRSVRIPWLAGRLEAAGEALTFDPAGVAAVGRWCTRWFAAPDGVGDQPPVVWLERRRGARSPYSPDVAVVADAVAGFVESVLWTDLPDARRMFTPGRPRQDRPHVEANEPGLGYHVEPGELLPWQLLQAARSIAGRGSRGADLHTGLIRAHGLSRTRLLANRARVSQACQL